MRIYITCIDQPEFLAVWIAALSEKVLTIAAYRSTGTTLWKQWQVLVDFLVTRMPERPL